MPKTKKIKKETKKQRDARIKRCGDGITKVLEAEKCMLDASVTITQKGNFPQIVIVPQDLEPQA